MSTYLQSLLALHAPPRRQRLGELGEGLVRKPGLVVEDVKDGLQQSILDPAQVAPSGAKSEIPVALLKVAR